MIATGGNTGNGGVIELSGHALIDRGCVNTLAPHGKTGTFLIDPTDINIVNGCINTCTAGTQCIGVVTLHNQSVGSNVSLLACCSISLQNSANLSLVANRNLTLTATNGTITTAGGATGGITTCGTGSVTLCAHADICIPNYRLTTAGSGLINLTSHCGAIGSSTRC